MFTKEEAATLLQHGIAVYRGKIITEAQPPITDAQVLAVEAKLTKPIPEELLALWRTSFGGSLNYVLDATFGEHRYSASFRELFYPNSSHYRDLFGWIEHELELTNEAEDEDGDEAEADQERPEIVRLPVLPFGGFEYLERLYVSLHDGQEGQVVLWARGLPPAWKMSLTKDAIAVVAQNVNELFDQLSLDEDPASKEASEHCTGTEMLEAVDELGKAAPQLAAKLETLIKKSVFDWRAQLSNSYEGTPPQQRALRLALKTAVKDDDASLLEHLNERGYPLDRAVSGTLTVLSLAASQGAGNVLDALLDCGRSLGSSPIVLAQALTLERVAKLIEADIAFDVDALFNVAAAGTHDAALRLVKDARRHGNWDNLAGQLEDEAQQAVESATRVDSGKLSSYLTADEYRDQARQLRTFAKMLPHVSGKNVKQLVADLDLWMQAHRADLLAKLNPPATDAELAELESAVGTPLPEDFRRLLKWRNGQPDDVASTFHPLTNEMFVSTSGMMRTMRDMAELVKYGDIEPSSWSTSWLPFMDNGGGDLSCLDAKTGAVIFRNHETNAVVKLTPTLRQWLCALVDELSTNNFSEWDIIECKPGPTNT